MNFFNRVVFSLILKIIETLRGAFVIFFHDRLWDDGLPNSERWGTEQQDDELS